MAVKKRKDLQWIYFPHFLCTSGQQHHPSCWKFRALITTEKLGIPDDPVYLYSLTIFCVYIPSCSVWAHFQQRIRDQSRTQWWEWYFGESTHNFCHIGVMEVWLSFFNKLVNQLFIGGHFSCNHIKHKLLCNSVHWNTVLVTQP